MRTALLLCLFIITALTPRAQKITYDPPSLPQPITQADYKYIVDTAVAVVSTKYKIEKVEGGAIHVIDDRQQPGTLNLDNLILKCLAEPDKTAWSGIIKDHFDKLFTSIDQQRALDPANYETVKKYLSIRIYPKETVDAHGGTDSLVPAPISTARIPCSCSTCPAPSHRSQEKCLIDGTKPPKRSFR